MKKFIQDSYLFIILFLIFLLKEPIYKLFTIKDNVYTPMRCSITESDYNKLLEFNEIDLIYETDYLNTYIIYKDIYNYLNEITIRGGKDKDLKNNVVIYDNTLVGVIDKVNKNTSIVKLITNNKSKISVKINEEVGILMMDDGLLTVQNISNNSDIKVGDRIYTSGIGITKENIYIGSVKEIKKNTSGIEEVIIVDYQLNIKDLLYVTVIKEDL